MSMQIGIDSMQTGGIVKGKAWTSPPFLIECLRIQGGGTDGAQFYIIFALFSGPFAHAAN